MSWLFSQALVEEFSRVNLSGGELSAQLNVMPTPHVFWRNDKMMDHSHLSRFGLTCAVLTADRGGELLTLFRAVFRVRTSVSLEREMELPASAQGSGEKCLGLLARYDRDSCSWKIPQRSLFAALESCLEIWPRRGLMRNGECWELMAWAPHTDENVSGLLPTPTLTDFKGSTPYQVIRRQKKNNGLTLREWLAKYSKGSETVYPNHGFLERAMGFPTGWTELKVSAMRRCLSVQRKPSEGFQRGLDDA